MAVKNSGGGYTPGGDKPKGKLYDWGDGKGRVHSRPKRSGKQLEKAKQNKRLDDPGYFTDPMTLRTAIQEAQRAGQQQYGPQMDQIALQQRQVPAWFDQYRAQLQTPAQVAQTYQPMIAQQQQVAQQTGQATRGVEGTSAQGTDAQAAAAREALANLGVATLQSQQGADTTYFQGRAPVAQAAQIGLQAQLASSAQSVARERGAYEQNYVTDARTRERAYGLDTQHQMNENKAFGLDVAKLQADIQDEAADRKQASRKDRRARKEKAQTVNQYGYTNEQWSRFSPSHRQRVMRQQKTSGSVKNDKALSPSERRAQRKEKRENRHRIDTIQDLYETAKYPANHPDKTKRGKRPSDREIISQLISKGYTRDEINKAIGSLRAKIQRPKNAPGANGQRRPTAYKPDTDVGGAEWRAGYERYKLKRWKKRGQGPSRRQIA